MKKGASAPFFYARNLVGPMTREGLVTTKPMREKEFGSLRCWLRRVALPIIDGILYWHIFPGHTAFMIKIKRGLDLPIAGAPRQVIELAEPVHSVALVGADYVGLKPSMRVRVGDRVRKGQVLFVDKDCESIHFTAPQAGVVAAIHRGDKRILQSVVIDVDHGSTEEEEFVAVGADQLDRLQRSEVVSKLLVSGLWTSLRARPYSKIPHPDSMPAALFINAMDSNPLAADPGVVISEAREAFANGVRVLRHLAPKTFVAKAPATVLPTLEGVQVEEFAGPHPAGLVGTHIHFLRPASASQIVWHLNYQDVIAIGKLFVTGRLNTERVISLAGPQVATPRLMRTVVGASLEDLLRGQLKDGENRIISGSILSGRASNSVEAHLGRYHLSVAAILEGRERELLGYLRPGTDKHSVLGVFVSALQRSKRFSFTSTTNGSPRAMVPVGAYEKVMPLDILPTQLLRYLIVGDTEMAQQLGALELDEEDLGLCTYVCPGKYEYGPILRDVLTRIEKEG